RDRREPVPGQEPVRGRPGRRVDAVSRSGAAVRAELLEQRGFRTRLRYRAFARARVEPDGIRIRPDAIAAVLRCARRSSPPCAGNRTGGAGRSRAILHWIPRDPRRRRQWGGLLEDALPFGPRIQHFTWPFRRSRAAADLRTRADRAGVRDRGGGRGERQGDGFRALYRL